MNGVDLLEVRDRGQADVGVDNLLRTSPVGLKSSCRKKQTRLSIQGRAYLPKQDSDSGAMK